MQQARRSGSSAPRCRSRAGFQDTDVYYVRLPARAQSAVPSSVWGLSRPLGRMAAAFRDRREPGDVRGRCARALAMRTCRPTGVRGGTFISARRGWRFVKIGQPRPSPIRRDAPSRRTPTCLLYLRSSTGPRGRGGIHKGRALSTPPPRANGLTHGRSYSTAPRSHGDSAFAPGWPFTRSAVGWPTRRWSTSVSSAAACGDRALRPVRRIDAPSLCSTSYGT
jgi:hypothetical protein